MRCGRGGVLNQVAGRVSGPFMGNIMTEQEAREIGIEAAREAYRQWDQVSSPYDHVWKHVDRLNEELRMRGLTWHDDLEWGQAGLAFRDEAQHLFGADYILGQ